MRLFSYVLRYDSGFAPNPYGRYCTLATCKPQIRRRALKGDWVLGVGSKNNVGNGKLVCAMQISEVLSLEEYDIDPRFQYKKPDLQGNSMQQCGDNIYYRDKRGQWRQRPSRHTEKDMEHDLSGRNVLIARHFFYLGRDAESIPPKYAALVCRGRGHRCNFPEGLVQDFIAWLTKRFPHGQHGQASNPPATLDPDLHTLRTCRRSKRSSRRCCH